MTRFSGCHAVKYEESAFRYCLLHTRRLTHEHHVRRETPLGKIRQEGSHAVLPHHLLRRRDCQYKVDGEVGIILQFEKR